MGTQAIPLSKSYKYFNDGTSSFQRFFTSIIPVNGTLVVEMYHQESLRGVSLLEKFSFFSQVCLFSDFCGVFAILSQYTWFGPSYYYYVLVGISIPLRSSDL